MGKIDRGRRFSVSANIILTASLITRTLTFGYVMLSIYIKVGDDILDTNVMKMMNIAKVFGMPLGSTVQSIVFSLIAVFALEFLTGIFGLAGAVGKKKPCLVVAVLMSSLMIMVYTVYIVLISLIYHKTGDFYGTFDQFAYAYHYGGSSDMNSDYYYNVYPGFLAELGCDHNYNGYYSCIYFYKEQVRTYLQTYFGIIITCILCHVVSIIAVEYTYRKLEFKETRTRLSSNKYYLLLTLRHGIGRTIVTCIRDNWKKSKVQFFSVVIKTVSLIVHLGLLGLGLTLCGDVFITDSSLRYIFYRLKFYQYTFYDILIGLAASSVVIGIVGVVTSTVGLLGTWKKSKILVAAGLISSTIMIIPKIIVIVLWSVFIDEINDEMRPQLRIQQRGYYYNNDMNRITGEWNNMVMTLHCCGVDHYMDTFYSGIYGQWFCCQNAHESRMNPYWHYYNPSSYLNYFGYCGGYKNDTCSGKILFKTRMYIGWFLAIVLLQVVIEISSILLGNKEYATSYPESREKPSQQKCFGICHSLTIVYRVTCSEIKLFIVRHCKRSKTRLVFLVSMAIIMILSFCTLAIAVNIRYDTVFGNGYIEELLRRISITDTNLNTAIENFSTVVSTFSVTTIFAVIYSICILVPQKCKTVLVVVSLGLWIVMALSHTIEIGLWSKFLKELNSSVTYQLATDIYSYYYSHGSEHYHPFSFYWNTLFVKGKCCGVSNTGSSFVGSSWYNAQRDRNTNQKIPVQCCTSQTEVYPYGTLYDRSCTDTPQSYHTDACDTVIEKRLKNNYSYPFLGLTSIILFAEILCIVTIIISLIRKDTGDMVDKTDKSELNPEVNIEEQMKSKTELNEKGNKQSLRKSKEKKIKKRRSKSKLEDNKGLVNEGKMSESYGLSENRRSSVMSRKNVAETTDDVTQNNETVIADIENKNDSNRDLKSVSKSNLSEDRHPEGQQTMVTNSNTGKRASVDIGDSRNSPGSVEGTGRDQTPETVTSHNMTGTNMNLPEKLQEARGQNLPEKSQEARGQNLPEKSQEARGQNLPEKSQEARGQNLPEKSQEARGQNLPEKSQEARGQNLVSGLNIEELEEL